MYGGRIIEVKNDEFAELVLMHQKSMYRLAFGILKNNHDAEDALSETIIKAYENLAGLRDENKFKPWIMTILVNVSKNMLAKKSRIQLADDITAFGEETAGFHNDIWDSVMSLGEHHMQIVILYYYDGFSTKEIAQILKVSQGTVKSRLSRARQHLKQLLSI